MKAILDLRSKPSHLVFEEISHLKALSIIDEMLTSYNRRVADPANKLRYTYIPGPLTLIGQQDCLRNFLDVNTIQPEVLYSFPTMPTN